MLAPFHLAIAVDDLAAAERFYGDLLGCPRGRRSDTFIDFDFRGHQLVVHLSPEDCKVAETNPVDGDAVPARHFGIILAPADWRALADHFARSDWPFLISPKVRFEGQPGEQGTFFVRDPAGNALEFKMFEDMGRLFATS